MISRFYEISINTPQTELARIANKLNEIIDEMNLLTTTTKINVNKEEFDEEMSDIGNRHN